MLLKLLSSWFSVGLCKFSDVHVLFKSKKEPPDNVYKYWLLLLIKDFCNNHYNTILLPKILKEYSNNMSSTTVCISTTNKLIYILVIY